MCFEIFFAECQKKITLGKEALCRVLKKHSANSLFAECQKNTRQRRLCRVPEKQHSANHLALGKEPVSGSESTSTDRPK